MSLLLDALKKAAESKSQTEDSTSNLDNLNDFQKIEESLSEETLKAQETLQELEALDSIVETGEVIETSLEENAENHDLDLDLYEIDNEETVALDIQENEKIVPILEEDVKIKPTPAIENIENAKEEIQKDDSQQQVIKPQQSTTENIKSTLSNDSFAQLIQSKKNINAQGSNLKKIFYSFVALILLLAAGYFMYKSLKETYLDLFDHKQHQNIETTQSIDMILPKTVNNQDIKNNHMLEKKQDKTSSTSSKTEKKNQEKNNLKNSNPVLINQKESQFNKQVSQYSRPKTYPRKVLKPKKIIKIQKTQSLAELIEEAYLSFQMGHLVSAKVLYQQAYLKAPNNRDVHLGLAAIAIDERNYTDAFKHYKFLLNLNPKDINAKTGVLQISKHIDATHLEAQLKLLLHQHPSSANLNFVLGNHYSYNKSWPQAYHFFLKAHQLDNKNPNITYNLAITAEHLGKIKNALIHYKNTVNFSMNRKIEFSLDIVKARITHLEQRL